MGRYQLREQLGAGGFGVVYRAHDELLRREVALKRIPRSPGGARDRANREALAAARLSHPAIVALYEACATDDAFFLITELVRGQTLARLIGDGALTDEVTLAVGCALCDALAHAHARGVIHRDVKPGNVIVPYLFLDGGTGTAAKLTDFGGASMSGAGALTRTGDVLGTLAYMAPEQAEGHDAEEAADLYSLALVLYEALSGTNPVRGTTPAQTARRIGQRVPSLAKERGDLSRELIDALDGALLARPRARGTLAELADALAGARNSAATEVVGLLATADDEPQTTRANRDAGRTATLRQPATPQRDGDSAVFFDDVEWSEDAVQTRADTRADSPRPRSRGARTPLVRLRRDVPSGTRASPLARAPRTAGPMTAAAMRTQRAGAEEQEDLARQGARARRRGLPRVAWLGCATAAIAWQLIAGRAGVALLLLAASAPLLAVPRRSAGAWLLAALAPLLGAIGLAGAYPALAAQLRPWRVRAALGALGYWWLTLAQPLAHTRLWLAAPRAQPPRAVWEGSLSHAVHVLTPMLSVGVLLGAAVWAAGAAALPLLARGRSALADALAVGAWSLALVLAAHAFDGPLPAGVTHASPRGAFVGAVFGAAIALGARALRGPA